MEGAQGEPIFDGWGTHSLVPTNVRCFERERGVVETARKLANSASVAICTQYPAAKGWVAVTTVRNNEILIMYWHMACRNLGGNPCSQKNGVMTGWGKVVDH